MKSRRVNHWDCYANWLAALKAGCNNGDADFIAQCVIDNSSHNDVGLGMNRLVHKFCCFVDLEETDI